MKAGINSVIIEVTIDDRDRAGMSSDGLYLPVYMRPLAYRNQIGKAVSVGTNIEGIQIGDTILAHHILFDNTERLVNYNFETGIETWCVRKEFMNNEIFGVIRNGEIIPRQGIVCAYSDESQNVMNHFKISVAFKNENDTDISIGDEFMCRPVSNYVISIGSVNHWFIERQYLKAELEKGETVMILDKIKAHDEQTSKKMDWTLISFPLV